MKDVYRRIKTMAIELASFTKDHELRNEQRDSVIGVNDQHDIYVE